MAPPPPSSNPPRTTNPPDRSEPVGTASIAPRRILLVRPSALGDVARTVPSLHTLRKAFPHARIEWLVHEGYLDVVRHHSALDEAVPFPRKQLGAILLDPAAAALAYRWQRDLRRRRYDLCVDLQGLARSGLIARITGAPHRWGFANAGELAHFAYTDKHFVSRELPDVTRQLTLLEAFGCPPVEDLRLHTGPLDEAWADQFLAEHDVDQAPYVCLAPTAKWRCKCWPLDCYAQLGERILDCSELADRVVVLAARSERADIQPLIRRLGPDRALCPNSSIGQSMALIRRCRALVCNDSAPMHLAVGLSRPLVALFGPTDPARTGPYNRPEAVVEPPGIAAHRPIAYRHRPHDQRWIQNIPVEAVWQRLQAVAELQDSTPQSA